MTPPLPLTIAPPIDLARRRAATVAILLALIVAAFEGTVVTTAMPTIAPILHGESLYAWVFAAYLIASTVGVLVFGKIADARGRRPVFLVGMATFMVGTIACGCAMTMPELVAFRVVQGLGAGALQPVAMTISADLYSLRERARIQALFTTVWGLANLVGPLVGGAIVLHLSWRWIFFVNVPVGLAAVTVLMITYRDPPRASGSLDGLGVALAIGASASALLLAVDRAGVLSVPVRLVAGLFSIALAAKIMVDQRASTHPLIAREVLAEPAVRSGVLESVFVGALLATTTAYVPLWFGSERGGGPLAGGAALTALLVGWAVGSTVGVRVLVRFGMQASVGGGMSLATLGVTTLALTAHEFLPMSLVLPALFVAGLGLGPAASTSLVACQSRASWTSRAMITSVVYATRSLGGSLLVAALGSRSSAAPSRFSTMALTTAIGAVLALAMAPNKLEARVD
jgi:hypothetical protein